MKPFHTLIALSIALSLILVSHSIFAAPPNSAYMPGETISPTCSPLSTNCSVQSPVMPGSNSNITSLSGLTTPLSLSQGGTGLSSLNTGDILYGLSNALTALPIGSDGQVLKITNGLPSWQTDLTATSSGDGDAPAFTAGTGIDAASLDSGIIAIDASSLNINNFGNTLSLSRGGIGISTISSGSLLYASSTNVLSELPAGLPNQVLKFSSGGFPIWGTDEVGSGGSGGTSYTAGTGIDATSLSSGTIAVNQSVLSLSSLGGTVSVEKGGTGATSADAAFLALAPSVTGNSGKFLTTNGTSVSWGTPSTSGVSWGSITGSLSDQSDISILLAGKQSSLGFTPLNSASNLSDLTNTSTARTSLGLGSLAMLNTINNASWSGASLSIANGGTGATTAPGALNALLPSQTDNNGKVLSSDGTNASWITPITGGVAWGSVSGTLANQTDLMSALSAKEPSIPTGSTTQYWRGDKTWQTLNSSVVGLGNVENTALSTWTGSSGITTLGTISSGIWSGTAVSISKGGTGATSKSTGFDALSPMTTLGDIIYGGSSGTALRLAGNTTPTKKFLRQTGDGTNASAPAWDTLSSTDIPAINLNASGPGGVSGTLSISNGGTGATTLTGAGIPVASCADVTTQTISNASIKTITTPNDGSAHTYSVSGYVTVTGISLNIVTLQVSFTDQNNTPRTLNLVGPGLTLAGISVTGFFPLSDMMIRAKANTAVTMKTTATGIGSQTYDVGVCITQVN